MIVVGLLVFGVVIFVHELGHFLVAKWSGIKVKEFAIGMGPTLIKFGKKETKYALRLLPIGGFVSMEGEDEESDDARSFQKAPIWKRILVTISGAIMNLLLGFLALVVMVTFTQNRSIDGNIDVIATRQVAQVISTSSGLQVGDTIEKINGRQVFTIADLNYEFARTKNGTFDILVKRDGKDVLLENVTFDTKIAYDKETGEPIIDAATGKPFEYLDMGVVIVGVPKSFLSVMESAFNNTLSYSRLIYLSLFDLITGRVAINQLSGPVGIISEIGKALSIGWQSVVQMLALISINLGIVNMLPLPALDGGRTVLLIVEAIRRKPLKQKYEIIINVAGFVLLIGLMVVVSFSDIQKLIMA
ncbi:MAG: RIP metalloprotease RseP [Ruminococcaceae bacterium]|nr:RIP metalloprotease RseP [Oscillospiraceae bacterium]